jgi:septum site-determining protein MinD
VTVSIGALVGTAGGVGTTRLAVELGAALAADGRDTIVVDTAFDTQGLSAYVSGPLDPDITTLLTAGGDLQDALVSFPTDTPGTLHLCPAHAPFARVATAKAPEAAEQLEATIETAAKVADNVVIDVPPLASNPAVAGAAAADQRGLVLPASIRGEDALSRTYGSLADLGLSADLVVANRAEDEAFQDADYSIPESTETDVAQTPACLSSEPGLGPAVAAVAEALFETTLDVDLSVGLARGAREYLR